MCVLVLRVSSVINLNTEVTTCGENIIEIFIGIRGINYVQLVFELHSDCEFFSS